MAEQFANSAQTTLNGAINDVVTSLVVTSATGFPTSGTFRIRIDDEILTVTAVAGTTFTISRATEAVAGVTAAASHSDGATISHVLTAGALISFATGTIGCSLYNSADLAFSTSSEAALTMNSEYFDTDGFHSTSSETQRVTIPSSLGGKYLVTVSIRGSTNQETTYVCVRKNGAGGNIVLNTGSANVGTVTTATLYNGSVVLDLSAGDTLDLRGLSSGAQNAIAAGGATGPWFTLTKLDSGRVGLELGGKAFAKVTRASSNFSVGNNTYTAVQWDAEVNDTDTMHDNSTNNSRIVIPSVLGVTTGLWQLKTSGYTSATSGRVDVMFRKNANAVASGGTLIDAVTGFSHSTVSGFLFITDTVLSATDYVECFIRTTGGTFAVIYDVGALPLFTVLFLGKVT